MHTLWVSRRLTYKEEYRDSHEWRSSAMEGGREHAKLEVRKSILLASQDRSAEAKASSSVGKDLNRSCP